MSRDVIADFLTIIRNGVRSAKQVVDAPFSKEKQAIAELLKEEGFLKDVVVVDQEGKQYLRMYLKYVGGESVIHEIERVSRPGLRSYSGTKAIRPVIGGLGITILSTNQGIITNKQARARNVGGEVLCTVW